MNALEFDRVSHDFVTPAGRTYRAIDEVSLAIPAGAFVALVGPSGCGKTTVLNLAAGLLTPSSGRVRVDGADLAGLNQRATYMFQQDALLPWKNVRDNVGLGLTLAGASKADACARADEWLARVGLSAFASHYPSQLSGGMRKRVAIAQNWILDRSQVLMDEPFSALDVHTRQLMETELLSLVGRRPSSGHRRTARCSSSRTTSKRRSRWPTRSSSCLPGPRAASWPGTALASRARAICSSCGPPLSSWTSIASIWSVLREEVIKSQSAVHRV